MSDDNRPHDDADETQTQWVPADRPPVDGPPTDRPADEPAVDASERGGWFSPATPATATDEPQWADWNDPWPPADEETDQRPVDPADEPFDQAADPEPEPVAAVDPPARPEPRAPSEYVSPYPTPSEQPTAAVAPITTVEPTATEQPAAPTYPTARDQTDQSGWGHPSPESERPSGPMAGRNTSWASLHQLRVLAQVACPILLLIGLTFSEDHAERGWQAYTAWACFAMVCAILQLAPLAARSLGLTNENAWFLAAVGTAGLVGYWVIIVLPGVSSNTGFAQTLAAGLAVIGLWLSPGRRL